MFVAIVAVIAVVAAGCVASDDRGDPGADGGLSPAVSGGTDGLPDSIGLIVDGGLDIAEAIAYEGIEVVAVRGYFVMEGDTARLCEALAESFPPQCGGVQVVVTNPDALPDTVLIQEGDTQWSESYVTVLGNIADGELTIASNVSG